MNLPEPVVDECQARGWGEVAEVVPLGGGCIHASYRLRTTGGQRLFLKTNEAVPADMFAREASGLTTLAVEGGPHLPRPLLWAEDFLLLEHLDSARAQGGYWERLGRELATLHSHASPQFGFEHDNYLGRTPQPNPWTTDGRAFFREHRLLFQARRARDAGLLDTAGVRHVEAIADGLDDLVPDDPACHYGWAEAELGMTELFGGFPDAFYQAYVEEHPLVGGWRERFPVYNLYHLLNHLNLFGAGYLTSVRSILQAYA